MTAGLWIAASLAAAAPPVPSAPCQSSPPSGSSVSGVTVTAQPDATQTSIDRRTYAVSKNLAAQSGSVADLLRDIPDVQVDAQGIPSLQGEGNVTILIDGRPSPQFSGQTVGQALQSLSASQIDRIEVMTNPPAQYKSAGGGGIINLITKRPTGAGWTGSARLTGETLGRGWASATLGYNAAKLSLTGDLVFGNRPGWEVDSLDQSELGSLGVIDSHDVSRQVWRGASWQGHLGADVDLDSRTRLMASLRLSTYAYDAGYAEQFVQDDVTGAPASALSRNSREVSSYSTGDASLTWRRGFGQDHDLTLSVDLSGSGTDDDRTDRLTPTLPPGQVASSQQILWANRLERDRLTADYERPLAGGELKLGYDLEYAPGRINQAGGAGGPSGPIVLNPNQHDVFLDTETDNEVYASYEHRLGRLTVLAGLRTEDARYALDQRTIGVRSVHSYPRLLPNLHLAYDLGRGRQLTASYSWRTNSPTDHQLDPFVLSRDPLHQQVGNPNLRPDDQARYEVAFEGRSGERTTRVTLFYHRRQNEMNEVYSNLPDGAYLEETLNAGQGRRAGAELALDGKLSPKLSYSLSLVGFWSQFVPTPALEAPAFGSFRTRSQTSGFGHADLTWKVTPKDLMQLDIDTTASGLDPQGSTAPTYTGNVGFRHAVNDQMAWILTAKDPLHSLRYMSVEDILGVEDRRMAVDSSRSITLTLVWNFGGRAKDQGIDFGADSARR